MDTQSSSNSSLEQPQVSRQSSADTTSDRMVMRQSSITDVFNGRWCLKKFTNEKKFQRRFIFLDRKNSKFCWSKQEGKTAPAKSISLCIDDVEVTSVDALSFFEEKGKTAVVWTINCPPVKGVKGQGVDIKMYLDDPECENEVHSREEFEEYVADWVNRIKSVIDEGFTH